MSSVGPTRISGQAAASAATTDRDLRERERLLAEKLKAMDLSRLSNPMHAPPTEATKHDKTGVAPTAHGSGNRAAKSLKPGAVTVGHGTVNYDDDFEEEDDEEDDYEEEEDWEAEEEEGAEDDDEDEDEDEEEEDEEDDEDEEDEEDDDYEVPVSRKRTMPVKLVRGGADAAVKTVDVVSAYTAKTFRKFIADVSKKCATDPKTTVLKATDREGDVVEIDDARSLSRLLSENWPGKNGNPKGSAATVLKIYVGDATRPIPTSLLSPGANLTSPPQSASPGSSTIPRNPFAAAILPNASGSGSNNFGDATLSGTSRAGAGTFRAQSGFFEGTIGGGFGGGATIVMPSAGLLQWNKMKLLGKGSFGTVHEGITNDGKLMAVKTVELPQEKVTDENDSDLLSLRSEINLMTRLKNPYIVAYYGCQTIEHENGAQTFEIFMEHCHGGSLTTLRKKFSPTDGKLKIGLARHYTRQILQGLKYLHENNVIHRDIKSDNVLISASGEAKLADFGCSKQLSTAAVEAGAQTVVGSPLFMAPEVISGDDTGYTFSADVWSVGCLLLELLGRKPWLLSGNNAFQLMFQISQCKTMPTGIPANCPPVLLDFFSKVFERDAAKRATAAALLEHEWLTCPDAELEEVELPAADAKSDLK